MTHVTARVQTFRWDWNKFEAYERRTLESHWVSRTSGSLGLSAPVENIRVTHNGTNLSVTWDAPAAGKTDAINLLRQCQGPMTAV